MELIGKAITKSAGRIRSVDKKTAEMAGSIVGAIVAAIAMVAAGCGGRSCREAGAAAKSG